MQDSDTQATVPTVDATVTSETASENEASPDRGPAAVADVSSTDEDWRGPALGDELDDNTVGRLGDVAKVRAVLKQAKKDAKGQRVRLAKQRATMTHSDGDEVDKADAEVRSRRKQQADEAYRALAARQERRRTAMSTRTWCAHQRASVSLIRSDVLSSDAADDREATAAVGLPTAMMYVGDERLAVKLDSGARYTIAGTARTQKG
ncbi:unnamed protein product [Phytophthora fragariaefolia]|uniref:Unnamed protein product n=1 Tax=Phytophthora fragariaefolia TaxID=1490495 RepID=A0A9W6YDG6_9STRA|nr:unnamed protein product [Phytophthora fragariaefolia]